MTRFILNRSNSLLSRNDQIIQYIKYNFLQHQIRLCSSYIDHIKDEEKKPKKKTIPIPKITLIHPDKSTTVTVLEAAERLAKRRSFDLIKVLDNDPKSNRSVYKLQSPSSYKIKDEIEAKEVDKNCTKYKATKLYAMKSKINEHDLDIKIKNMNKVLGKMHKVKIVVNNPDGVDLTNIVELIQKKLNGYKEKESIQKGTSIFLFSPLLNGENNSLNNNIDNIIEPSNKTE
ncbi:hypothetical protein ANTPLA_LOCUS7050 [Anthophora plagiata]